MVWVTRANPELKIGRVAVMLALALGTLHCEAYGVRTAYPGEPLYHIGGGSPVPLDGGHGDAGSGSEGHGDGGSQIGPDDDGGMCPGGVSLWADAGLVPDGGPTDFPACVPGNLLLPSVPWPRIPGDPLGAAVGDLNGDGKPDLIVSVSVNASGVNHGNIAVLLGKGDGTFTTGGTFAVGNSPFGVATTDFNSDHVLDVVVSNSVSGTLSVLLGNGDGTFQPERSFAAGVSPSGLATGDFNGDGNADVAVADNFGDVVSVLLGNGDGTLRPAKSYMVGTAPEDVAVADFNGDGKLDLAVTNLYAASGGEDGTVSILLGDGQGSFEHVGDFSAGDSPWDLAVADFNGDGKPDVVVADNAGNNVSLLPGLGTGALGALTSFPAGAEPWGITAGDFNGDGKPDIVVTNSAQDTVSVLLGNGTGFESALGFGVGASPTSVVASDIDGDGHLDLIVPNGGGDTVGILLGIGSGAFRAGVPFGGETGPQGLAAADFDGDGNPDLAVANNASNTISVLMHNKCGFLVTDHIQVGAAPWGVVTGDLNADGWPDLAVTNSGSGTVTVLLNMAKGAFATTTIAAGAAPQGIAIQDLNGDGALDLVVADSAATTVTILLGKGDGTFNPGRTFSAGSSPTGVAIGDFNGDGRPDLAVTDAEPTLTAQGGLVVLLGNGDGTFQAPLAFNAGENLLGVTVGDFDHDGKLDVAVVSQQQIQALLQFGSVSVLRGNGDGTFSSAVPYPVGFFPNEVVTADFNQDGVLDLAVSNSDGVDMLLGNGDGTFTAVSDYGAGPAAGGFTDYCSTSTCAIRGPSGITTSDFNGDGLPDLAVSVYDGNDVNVMLNAACGH